MASEMPSFLRPSKVPTKESSFLAPRLPDWLSGSPRRDPTTSTPSGNSPEVKRLLLQQFELFFPRVLDRMYAGETMNRILEDFPIPIDRGAFMRWVTKDSTRHNAYKEAKTIRTEIWTGEMIRHAEGTDSMLDLDRAKFLVETYKFLIKAENKKEYGDTKQVEITQNISITAALAAAEGRIEKYIDARVVDDTDDDDQTIRYIEASVEYEE